MLRWRDSGKYIWAKMRQEVNKGLAAVVGELADLAFDIFGYAENCIGPPAIHGHWQLHGKAAQPM